MANKKAGQHLSEKELITAVIDRQDLLTDVQAHLDVCPGCRSACADLERELGRLGQRARRWVPAAKPGSALGLGFAPGGAQGQARNRKAPRLAGPAWAVLACAVLLLLLVSRGSEHGVPSLPNGQDEQGFLAEVACLSENPLPASFGNIAPEGALLDDTFMEFLVPLQESESAPSTGYRMS